MNANEKQVGGDHYKSSIQHWDYVVANDLDYFQGQITLYVTRWKKKGGIEDLEKAMHFLEKYIEVEKIKKSTEVASEALKNIGKLNHPAPFGYDALEEVYYCKLPELPSF